MCLRQSSQRTRDHPAIPETEVAAVADNHVVEHLDAEHLAGMDQPPGEQDVLLARLDVSARMIVDKNDSRGGLSDGGLEGLTRVDDGGSETPNRHDLIPDDLFLYRAGRTETSLF